MKIINSENDKVSSRVCLVTEELSGIGGSGGIGAAFFELGKLLANSSVNVDILYCPIDGSIDNKERQNISRDFLAMGIKLTFLDYSKYVELPITYEKKSYAISRYLSQLVTDYSHIHFHDYKGLGYFSTSLKRQGLSFANTELIVQLHGPTRWTIEENGGFFVHEDQLKIDFMERMSIAQADFVVSPSRYLVEWLDAQGYTLPKNVHVIKNVCSDLSDSLGVVRRQRVESSENKLAVTDVICFARHEDRKGFSIFCDAIDLINDQLAENRITVTFLGKFGMVGSQPSGVYLIDRSKKWKFPLKVRSGFARNAAATYIVTRKSPLVVIPSPAENSPYTVLESIVLGVPVVSSLGGGGSELFSDLDYPGLCDITAKQIADKILIAIEGGIRKPIPSETPLQIEQNWLAFHNKKTLCRQDLVDFCQLPKVTFAITHFERPEKLTDAIISAVRQTYKNIEIIVIDDGSSSKSTLAALKEIEILLERVGGKLLRQSNSYLGAARNAALRAATGDYICFLDDDDIAKPELIEKLVTAAVSGGFDVVNCMNIFMNEACRGDVLARTENLPENVSYVPLGGPISLAATENCLGAATALFKKSSLIDIGGYTELKGVGHEDYELFIRFSQAGKRITIVPIPLYYYEVGRPSMLSRTSMVANFRRCFDALDMCKQPQAMRDTISLTVGKNVSLNSHNRQHWIYSLTTTSAVRNRILTQPLSRVDMLNSLIELATQEKLLKIRMAYEEDLSQDLNCLQEDSEESLGELLLEVDQSKDNNNLVLLDSIIVNIQLDIALGRYSVAMDEVCDYLKKKAFFTDVLANIIRELVLSSGEGVITETQWRDLSVAMRKVKFPKKLFDDGVSCLLYASVLGGLFEYASTVLPALIAKRNSEYINAYPDVAEAIKGGSFDSGFDHYLAFGFYEGRKGFSVINDLFEIIGRLHNQNEIVKIVFSKEGKAAKIVKLFDGFSCLAV